MAQNNKKFCLSCSISQEPHIIWSLFIVNMCKRIISPGIFCIFWNFNFLGCWRRLKVQKMAWNDQKSCLSHSVSLELYIIWLLVHMRQMIPPAIVFTSSKFWCFRVLGQKMTQNYQFQPIRLYISGIVDHIRIFGTQV